MLECNTPFRDFDLIFLNPFPCRMPILTSQVEISILQGRGMGWFDCDTLQRCIVNALSITYQQELHLGGMTRYSFFVERDIF